MTRADLASSDSNHESASRPSLGTRVVPPWEQWIYRLGLVALVGWLATGVAKRMLGLRGGERYDRYYDFLTFHTAGARILDGADIYTAEVLGYVYPPLYAVLMAPLGALPIATAAWIWLAVKVVALVACAHLAARETQDRLRLPRRATIIVVLMLFGLLVGYDRVRVDMNQQENNVVILLMFVLGLRWIDRRPALAGVALGFGAAIKYVTLVTVPYLLLRRRFAAAAWTLVATVAWLFLPALVLGWDLNLAYLGKALGGLLHLTGGETGEAAKVLPATFGVSIPAFTARAFGDGGHNGASVAALAAIFAAFAGCAIACYRRASIGLFRGRGGASERDERTRGVVLLEWSGLIVILLAFGPQTNDAHEAMLLLPCVAAIGVLLMPGRVVPGAVLVLGIVVMVITLASPMRTCWGIVVFDVALLYCGLDRLSERGTPVVTVSPSSTARAACR